MKLINFIIFFSILITILGLGNFYVFIRGWKVIPADSSFRIVYACFFIFLAVSFVAGRIIERFYICPASGLLIWIGSFWLGILLYLFIGTALIDLLRLFDYLFNIFPQWVHANYGFAKMIAACTVASAAILIVIAGFINSYIPKINTIDISIPKKAGSINKLDIALATDIHLGTIVSNSKLVKLVDTINGLNPDIVLLAGDIVDEDLSPVIEKNLGEILKMIKSRYGTYAITGNHEFIGGVDAACDYLSKHGIIMLRDSHVLIDKSFYLVGREDLSIQQFRGQRRKPLESLLQGLDMRLPVILLDHQPVNLNSAVNKGIDLQLSGHTHNGQIWPIHHITARIYELIYGYKKIENTHFYVSGGFGTWGPPVRVGSRPEIAMIKLKFDK
jgi:uncharacterized protein